MRKTTIFGVFALVFILVFESASPAFVKASTDIPSDALSYNGHYYYYYEGTVTWEVAKEECEKLGGHLVTFSNKKEEDAIWEYIRRKGTPAWIGLYNAGAIDRIFGTVDSDWKWVTGEKVKYTNWAKNEPDSMSHFLQTSYDMWAVIGKSEDVTAGHMEDSVVAPCWGDFDDDYVIGKEYVKGYVCEWDVYEVEVEKKSVSLKKGKKTTIGCTVYDMAGHTKIKDAKVSYKSSNKKVAKVSKTGKITALKAGKCTITVKYKDATAKVKVTVTKK